VKKVSEKKLSPLHLIAGTGDEETVALLHEKGAEVNEENVRKETPLYVAAAEANIGVCKELIKRYIHSIIP
jgi:ankyrin repeat protein